VGKVCFSTNPAFTTTFAETDVLEAKAGLKWERETHDPLKVLIRSEARTDKKRKRAPREGDDSTQNKGPTRRTAHHATKEARTNGATQKPPNHKKAESLI